MSKEVSADFNEANDDLNTKDPHLGWMIVFLFTVSFVGLFSVVPLRKVEILKPPLIIPKFYIPAMNHPSMALHFSDHDSRLQADLPKRNSHGPPDQQLPHASGRQARRKTDLRSIQISRRKFRLVSLSVVLQRRRRLRLQQLSDIWPPSLQEQVRRPSNKVSIFNQLRRHHQARTRRSADSTSTSPPPTSASEFSAPT